MTSSKQVTLIEHTLRTGDATFYYEDTKKASIKKLFYTMPDGVLRYTKIDKRKKTEKRLFDLQISNIVRHMNSSAGWAKKAPLKKKSKSNGVDSSPKNITLTGNFVEDGRIIKNAFNKWIDQLKKEYPRGVHVDVTLNPQGYLEVYVQHSVTL